MKQIVLRPYIAVILFLVVISTGTVVRADLYYTPTQYNNLYNEKVAVEFEIKKLRRQFKNEKANLEATIKDLHTKIQSLDKELELAKKERAEDKEAADSRIEALQNTINLLKQKSSGREQDLLSQNKKIQEKYEAQLTQLRNELEKERKKYIQDLEALRSEYERRNTNLSKQIRNLEEELSSLKRLTKAQKQELERMENQAKELEKQLAKEIKEGQIRLKKFHNKLIINIDDRISFDSGSAQLKRGILPALDKIKKILEQYPEYTIMVEGHTDNVPIHTRQFRDNWQLSTERALAVLGYILRNKKLDRSRFAAAGYGEYNPIVPNDTPENRALNRRVDIVVIPRIKTK
jgi:chemotaxis protein MotB